MFARTDPFWTSSTIANPIDKVLTALGVSMVGSSAQSTYGTLAGTVTASGGGAISGATVSTDSGQSATTDSNGAYSIANVPTGTRTVTATATGYASASQQATVNSGASTTVNFVLQAAGNQAIVKCVDYKTQGGKNSDKDLLITITIVDNSGAPVAGAQVDISVTLNGSPSGNGTGAITGTSGQATYTLRNAANGTYVTTVTAVAKAGLTFEGSTPANSFTKNGSGSASFCRVVAGRAALAQAALDNARNIKARHSDALRDIEDVVGHGISRNEQGEPVTEIYLTKENANARARIPASLEDVPVRVVVTGPFTPRKSGWLAAALCGYPPTRRKRHDVSSPICSPASASHRSHRQPPRDCAPVFRATQDGRPRFPNRLRGRGYVARVGSGAKSKGAAGPGIPERAFAARGKADEHDRLRQRVSSTADRQDARRSSRLSGDGESRRRDNAAAAMERHQVHAAHHHAQRRALAAAEQPVRHV
jgi:hypothetical protein